MSEHKVKRTQNYLKQHSATKKKAACHLGSRSLDFTSKLVDYILEPIRRLKSLMN